MNVPSSPELDELNSKELLVATSFLKSANPTHISKDTGIGRTALMRILNADKVKKYIANKLKDRSELEELTREWVLIRAKRMADVISNPDDERFEPSAANRTLELLGKQFGLFKDQIEITASISSTAEAVLLIGRLLESLPEEENELDTESNTEIEGQLRQIESAEQAED